MPPSFNGPQEQVQLQGFACASGARAHDFFSRTIATRYEGLTDLEALNNQRVAIWAGPQTVLRFDLPTQERLKLAAEFINHLDGQGWVVLLNGKPVAVQEVLGKGAQALEHEFEAPAGRNELRIVFKTWNHKDARSVFAPDDQRPLSVRFLGLTVNRGLPQEPPSH